MSTRPCSRAFAEPERLHHAEVQLLLVLVEHRPRLDELDAQRAAAGQRHAGDRAGHRVSAADAGTRQNAPHAAQSHVPRQRPGSRGLPHLAERPLVVAEAARVRVVDVAVERVAAFGRVPALEERAVLEPSCRRKLQPAVIRGPRVVDLHHVVDQSQLVGVEVVHRDDFSAAIRQPRIDRADERERRVVGVGIDQQVVGPRQVVVLAPVIATRHREPGRDLALHDDAFFPVETAGQAGVETRRPGIEPEVDVTRRPDLVVLSVAERVQRRSISIQVSP